MADDRPTKRDLRQRWLDHNITATKQEAKQLVAAGLYASRDPNYDMARLNAFRAGYSAGLAVPTDG